MPHYRLQRVLARLDRNSEAAAITAKLVETYPNNAGGHYDHGWVLQRLGRHADAIQSFDQALALSPPEIRAYFARGVSLEYLGKWDEAVEWYRLAARHRVTVEDATANLADLASRLGEWSVAAEAYESLFTHEATFQNGLRLAWALHKAGRSTEIKPLLETLGKMTASRSERLEVAVLAVDVDHELHGLALLRDLSAENPGDAEVLSAWACALAYVGESGDARARLEELRLLEPSSLLLHGTEGTVALRCGQPLVAVESFDRALALDPTDMQLLAFRGAALHAAGRVNEAWDVFKEIEQNAPEVLEQDEWRAEWDSLKDQRRA